MTLHMYNIDMKECLDRGKKFLGEEKKYEGCVRAILVELKAHQGEKVVLDIGCFNLADIRQEIADVIRKILFSEEARDVDLYFAFMHNLQKERFQKLTPDLNWIDLKSQKEDRLILTVAN